MVRKPDVRVRRVYDQPSPQDGTRVLVDRVWPRGLTKSRAQLGEWCKQVAPSTALRKWYGHDPERFEEFRRRYRAELEEPERAKALQHLRELAKGRTLTLLTATRRPEIARPWCSLICSGPDPGQHALTQALSRWYGTVGEARAGSAAGRRPTPTGAWRR